MPLFLLFLAVPLIEIALFIQVGSAIGLASTLLIVVLTAILGTWLVKNQGAMALSDVKRSFNEVRDPTEPLAHGAMILFSGALLLTPGFFTDACGFALLVPQVRTVVFNYLRKRVKVTGFTVNTGQSTTRPQSDDGVIDGDFEVIDPDKRPTHRPSGWTRH